MRPPSSPTNDAWPPDYTAVFAWRQRQLERIRSTPDLLAGALAYYARNPVDFINHWVDTYDPRNAVKGDGLPARVPLILFPRQVQLIEFFQALVSGEEDGLVEKCRDMGATWVAAAYSVWAWRFIQGSAIGWGSRKEQLVDRLGDPDSIFEKIRMIVRGLPMELRPPGFTFQEHAHFMRLINPEHGATITGEAGDNIGRGGRKLIYFKDESAHYERPELIEAALADNTRIQVDISSVRGLGNVFHRRREAGVEWQGGPALKGVTNVFVMDWRDHPAKDQAWYDRRRAKALADGLSHVFAQEVDRNYSAAVDGIIVPAEWINSAIDVHKKLGWPDGGPWTGGLDVADEGGDKNALALRQGPVLRSAEDWGEGDVGQTARRAVTSCRGKTLDLMYDCVGVGAGVKSETNRLASEGRLPKGLHLVPWHAGAKPALADEPVEPDDDEAPTHGEMYQNLKAQAWWEIRRRFARTHQAVTEGVKHDPDLLISLPAELPKLRQIQKELSQATASRSSSTLKLIVNKSPDGTRSPNLADAIVMAYWPVGLDTYSLEHV